VRITETDGTKPKVSINLPLGLAEMLFKSLPDDAKADLRREGYDPEPSGRGFASSVRARSSRSKATTASASRSGPRSKEER
jgi:hypothetical protein